MNTALAKYLKDHRDWEDRLPYILFAMRSAKSDATGFSPAYLMFGRELRFPHDIPSVDLDFLPVSEYASALADRLTDAWEEAKKVVSAAVAKNKKASDKLFSDEAFSKNDLVMRKMHTLSSAPAHISHKYSERWDGPHLITHVHSPTQVSLRNLLTGKSILKLSKLKYSITKGIMWRFGCGPQPRPAPLVWGTQPQRHMIHLYFALQFRTPLLGRFSRETVMRI